MTIASARYELIKGHHWKKTGPKGVCSGSAERARGTRAMRFGRLIEREATYQGGKPRGVEGIRFERGGGKRGDGKNK